MAALSPQPLFEALARLPDPIVVLASGAGWGNRTAGRLIADWAGAGRAIYAEIESGLSPALARRHFGRHRWLCRHAPWLLGPLARFGRRHAAELVRLQRRMRPPAGLERLPGLAGLAGAGCVIATNHRAAFFVAALKLHGLLDCRLEGVVTDYAWGPGWRHLPWPAIERVWAPVGPPPGDTGIPWHLAPIPVRPEIAALAGRPGAADELLVSGGGWGLGRMLPALRSAAGLRHLKIHVACGENERLRRRLARWPAHRRGQLLLYGPLPSLEPLLARCGTAAVKPGGVSLAEVQAAGRRLLLLPGLPGVEEANARHALAELGAAPFAVHRLPVPASGRPPDRGPAGAAAQALSR